MSRIYVVLGVVASAVAVLTVGTAGGVAKTASGKTLTYVEQEGTLGFNFVDTEPASPNADPESPDFRTSIGDELEIASKVNNDHGHQVGSLLEQATTERGGKLEESTYLFHVTLRLPHGDIVASGAFQGESSTLAVVGGTGRYEGARGTLAHGAEGPDGEANIVVHLLP